MRCYVTSTTYDDYRKGCAFEQDKRKPLSAGKFSAILDAIGAMVCELTDEAFTEMEETLKKRGSWVMEVDTAWSHRGCHARQAQITFLNFETGLPVYTVELTKARFVKDQEIIKASFDYAGTSKGMEAYGTFIGLAVMRDKGLIDICTGRVSDADGSLDKVFDLYPDTQRLKRFLDPGHSKKNFMASLKEIFGQKMRFAKLSQRMGCYFMRCQKEAITKYPNNRNAAKAHFLFLWSFWPLYYREV